MYLEYNIIFIIMLTLFVNCDQIFCPKKSLIWGPGLFPHKIVLPARYFYIQAVDINGLSINKSLGTPYSIKISGISKYGQCQYFSEQIDRKDGTVIVRYKLIDECENVELHIKYDNEHVALSPYRYEGNILADNCNCPVPVKEYIKLNNCSTVKQQIIEDLKPFRNGIIFHKIRSQILKAYNRSGSVAICNYVIIQNEIYRRCYGQHTGFKMFIDSVLNTLVRQVLMPNIEFFINLGDYPLVKKGMSYSIDNVSYPYPMFSWCGSEDTFDIVLPTYDITESSLESMGRITLDMLSVQRVHREWKDKFDKAFWRGRDSSRERLKLIHIAREMPDIFNVSLTNFFFFPLEEKKYGPKSPHMAFMDFFDYKYQLNIDGTVAAYRLPYLLGGNSVVLKQESPFYEHFYSQLIPYQHFIPFKRNLSDLVTKIMWAQNNEEKALQIIKNANNFVNDHLLPTEILCYHVLLMQEWRHILQGNIHVLEGMEKVDTTSRSCNCKYDEQKLIKENDEL